MSTDKRYITVSNISVELVRKDIKNLHLAVYPPEGSVRLAVPNHVTDDNARLMVVSRLAWIKKQQAVFQKQPRQSERQFVTGESHYLKGRRYLLTVVETSDKSEVKLTSNARIKLFVEPGSSQEQKKTLMEKWYRQQLRVDIQALLEKWLPIIDKPLAGWGIRRMKTKWGSCNATDHRIWLNLELAKKSPECLEYILVHELVHLYERHHNARFIQLMDTFLPDWRMRRDLLNNEPLAHEDWGY